MRHISEMGDVYGASVVDVRQLFYAAKSRVAAVDTWAVSIPNAEFSKIVDELKKCLKRFVNTGANGARDYDTEYS